MNREYFVCVLDFEATCEKDRRDWPNEVIEFPSVLWIVQESAGQRPIFTFISEIQHFVKPEQNKVLTAFCKELTGITQEQVDAGIPFLTAFKEHYAWLCKHVPQDALFTIVTCGNWDLATMLPKQLKLLGIDTPRNVKAFPRAYARFLNMKYWFKDTLKRDRTYGMDGMLNILKLPLIGRHHSGIDDCRNIWRIVQDLIENRGLSLANDVRYKFDVEPWPKNLELK